MVFKKIYNKSVKKTLNLPSKAKRNKVDKLLGV